MIFTLEKIAVGRSCRGPKWTQPFEVWRVYVAKDGSDYAVD